MKSRVMAEYSLTAGPDGRSTQKALRVWSNRATENSQIKSRTRGGETRLPDTGGAVQCHSTSAPPRMKRT